MNHTDRCMRCEGERFPVAEMFNEMVWQAGLGALGAYALVQHCKADRPEIFIFQSSAVAAQEAMLAWTMDGIFTKSARILSPICSTAFVGGVSLVAAQVFHKMDLTKDVLVVSVYSLAMVALARGSTRKVFNKSCYPPIRVIVPSAINGLLSPLKYLASKISWFWDRHSYSGEFKNV